MFDGGGVTLSRVVAETAPAAERLVDLLAPWDRARLRLTCRALAGAVPAAACAMSLSAMVRRAGGAGLLRYGAGDAQSCWMHALIAVEADAADALRWLLGRRVEWSTDPKHTRELRHVSLLTASAGAWRVLGPLPSRPEPDDTVSLLMDAWEGGSEALVAERAAAAAECAARGELGYRARNVLRVTIQGAWRRDAPALLVPFLRLGARCPYARRATVAAVSMGRRDLVEPGDWLTQIGNAPFSLRVAVRSGDLALARTAFDRCGMPTKGERRELLHDAVQCRRDAPAMLDWVTRALNIDAALLLSCGDQLVTHAVRGDAVAALCWVLQRTGPVPAAELLRRASENDAVACIEHLVIGVEARSARDLLSRALVGGAFRAASALAPHSEPLDGAALVRLMETLQGDSDACHVVRVMSLLRRHALLPAPGPAFLRECLRSGRQRCALAAAGYRVDADARAWLDSVRPHCVGTPRRVWRPMAHNLRDRYQSAWDS